LRVEVVPTQEGAPLPQPEVCCAAGNEQYGNPVTIPVTVGTERRVEVGQGVAGRHHKSVGHSEDLIRTVLESRSERLGNPTTVQVRGGTVIVVNVEMFSSSTSLQSFVVNTSRSPHQASRRIAALWRIRVMPFNL
jgi:hypothetical protein